MKNDDGTQTQAEIPDASDTPKDEQPSEEKGMSQLDKELADSFPASDPPATP